MCSNIPAATAYGVYISQLIRYSRACGSNQDFLDRGLLLTRNLLNQGLSWSHQFESLRSPQWPGCPLWNMLDVRAALTLFFCVMFCISLFVLFLLSIVLSVLRRTASDYPFDIFKLFLHKNPKHCFHLNITRTVKLELQTVKG